MSLYKCKDGNLITNDWCWWLKLCQETLTEQTAAGQRSLLYKFKFNQTLTVDGYHGVFMQRVYFELCRVSL